MQDSLKDPPETVETVSGAVKGMAIATMVALVLASLYSVALGGSGLLWFAWVILGLLTLGLVTAENS